MRRSMIVAIVLVGFSGSPAFAQRVNTADTAAQEESTLPRLQVGLGFKSTVTPGDGTTNSVQPDFVWRWRGKERRTDPSWALSYGLTSVRSQVSSSVGAAALPVGDMHARPLMAGVDYKIPHGRWQWSVGASVGWSMNRIDTPRTYHHRAAMAAGASDLWVDVDNSLVWGPRLKGWYDVNRRVSFMVESAYLMNRPALTLRANGQTTTSRLNADALIVKTGVVYGIF